MNKHVSLWSCVVLILASGCTVKGDYTCGVPNNGVRCQPMNDTHQQLYDGSLNSLHVEPFPEDDSGIEETDLVGNDDDYYMTGSTSVRQTPQSAIPNALISIKTIDSKQAILSPPREMRIWFDRFTDPDGDLHDESFMFIRLDNGHWVIDNKPVLY